MRFKALAALQRPELQVVPLGALPQRVAMTRYAREKAFRINDLVASVHSDSLEWYGFTLGTSGDPDLIVDIGLPPNDLNLHAHTTLSPAGIAAFQESLPGSVVINGWIHSHGSLTVKHFSPTDDRNHRVVLDFTAAGLRRPVAKREVAVKDMVFLVQGRFVDEDLAAGSVCLITDTPVTTATIMETIYGSFCYAIVIGDQGWQEQEIHYQENGVLSGYRVVSQKKAELLLVETGRVLTPEDTCALRDEVAEKIHPNTNPPVEVTERM
jgi:hypothetical protein